jgi:pimeloyl-ACP methyl ester carboxylesterase
MERERYTLDVRGGMFSIDVTEYGAKDAEPLLWLHPSNSLMRFGYLDDLGERYRVIAPLHPGWGESTGLAHIDDPVDMALYYYDFLDALGIESAHVVGHSIGGMFAAEVAALDPHRVRRVVLCNAVGLWRDDAPTLDFFAEDQAKVGRAVWKDPTGPAAMSVLPDMSDPAKLEDFMFRHIQSMAAAAKFLWPIPDRGLRKRVHRIAAPTLLLWGRHDGLVSPVYAEEFAARIRDAEVAIFEESAHFPMIEERERFKETVLGFLGR